MSEGRGVEKTVHFAAWSLGLQEPISGGRSHFWTRCWTLSSGGKPTDLELGGKLSSTNFTLFWREGTTTETQWQWDGEGPAPPRPFGRNPNLSAEADDVLPHSFGLALVALAQDLHQRAGRLGGGGGRPELGAVLLGGVARQAVFVLEPVAERARRAGPLPRPAGEHFLWERGGRGRQRRRLLLQGAEASTCQVLRLSGRHGQRTRVPGLPDADVRRGHLPAAAGKRVGLSGGAGGWMRSLRR